MEYGSRSAEAAVECLRRALGAGDAAPAAASLGARRGGEGVPLAASLDDLAALHRTIAGDEPPAALLRRFAIAWSEGALGALLARGALDAVTGLPTSDYLAIRLRDLARSGECARRRLVVATAPAPVETPFGAMLRCARAAGELAASFPRAETPVGLPSGHLAVIAPRDGAFGAHLARARVALRTIDAGPFDVESLELPATEDAVPAFLADL